MPRQRHHSSHSNYPVSRPGANSFTPSRQDPEIIEKIQELLLAGNAEEALQQLVLVPKWIQNNPSYALLRATALMQHGDMDASGEILRDLERKSPNFIQLYLPLATWYMSREWPVHALRSVKKVLDTSGPEASFRGRAETLADTAQAAIQFLAAFWIFPSAWRNRPNGIMNRRSWPCWMTISLKWNTRPARHYRLPRAGLPPATTWPTFCTRWGNARKPSWRRSPF
jgi:hypothetical protein